MTVDGYTLDLVGLEVAPCAPDGDICFLSLLKETYRGHTIFIGRIFNHTEDKPVEFAHGLKAFVTPYEDIALSWWRLTAANTEIGA